MDPIFDRYGKVIAWFRHEDAIVDRLGQYRAFISNGAVFDYQSRFLGRLYAGYIRDRDGKAVGFVMGARDGPVLPSAGAIPRPPIAGPEPARPSQPVAGDIPAYSQEWSDVGWEKFLDGKRKSDLADIIK